MPPDGMILALVTNIYPEEPKTTVSLVAITPKPRPVKLEFIPSMVHSRPRSSRNSDGPRTQIWAAAALPSRDPILAPHLQPRAPRPPEGRTAMVGTWGNERKFTRGGAIAARERSGIQVNVRTLARSAPKGTTRPLAAYGSNM